MDTVSYNGRRDGIDKRKVTCFLGLVLVGFVCILLMIYMLFYARPHANSEIRQGRQSELRLLLPEVGPDMSPALTPHAHLVVRS